MRLALYHARGARRPNSDSVSDSVSQLDSGGSRRAGVLDELPSREHPGYDPRQRSAMRNLNLHVNVPADRKVVLQLPDEVDPGEVELTVIVRHRRKRTQESFLSRLPELHVEAWPESHTFSRSEIYDDDGR
jgi:hypothetical protein